MASVRVVGNLGPPSKLPRCGLLTSRAARAHGAALAGARAHHLLLAYESSTSSAANSVAASAPAPTSPRSFPSPCEGVLAGVWLGLWHGAIAPVTFLLSLFKPDVGMYEVHNNGGWYNFGFLFGIMLWGGGSHGARRAKAPEPTQAAP